MTGETVTSWPLIPNLTDTWGWANGMGVSLSGDGGDAKNRQNTEKISESNQKKTKQKL